MKRVARGEPIMNATPFEPGGAWLRADFRLHTKADRRFSDAGDASYYFATTWMD